jgi:hypothetical protein
LVTTVDEERTIAFGADRDSLTCLLSTSLAGCDREPAAEGKRMV